MLSAKDILSKMVAINSTFPNEGKLGEYICRLLKSQDFKVNKQYVSPGRFNIFAERGSRGRPLLFYGHTDTVPIYGDWKTDPMKLTKKGDKLFGLGSCDMKGGVAGVLEAINHINKTRRIKLLFCVDEENISKGVYEAIKRRSWFNDISFAICVEPGHSAHQTGGENTITVGRRGRVIVCVDIIGLSSHGANPQKGINALEEASKIALSIKKFKLTRHHGLGKEAVFVNCIEGRSTSLSVPDRSHMEIDVQLVPPNKLDSAKRRVEMLIKELYKTGKLNKRTKTNVYIKKRETPYINPYVGDLKNPSFRSIRKIIEDNFGKALINYGSSVADDNIIHDKLSVHIITLGPSGGNIHTSNEWLSERSLKRITSLYEQIINNLK